MHFRTRHWQRYRSIDHITIILTLCALISAAMTDRAFGAETPTVAIVLTPHESYRQAASALESEVAKFGYRCIRFELPQTAAAHPGEGESSTGDSTSSGRQTPSSGTSEATPAEAEASALGATFKKLALAKPSVIVTTGATATSLVLENVPKIPVVFCVLPNAEDMPFMAQASPHRKRLTGVTTDVSPEQQIQWIKKLAPKAKHFGLFYSSRSKRTAETIEAEAKTQGIKISIIEASREKFPEAVETLNSRHCDGVVMIPDARIYNSATVQRLLLWGIRSKKPVWTFSANVVKAGAFAGHFSDRKSIGRQTAELVKKVLSGADIEKVGLRYPNSTYRAINVRTADMIGIHLDSDTQNSGIVLFNKQK